MRQPKVILLSADGTQESRISQFSARKALDAKLAKVVTTNPFKIQAINDAALSEHLNYLKKGEE